MASSSSACEDITQGSPKNTSNYYLNFPIKKFVFLRKRMQTSFQINNIPYSTCFAVNNSVTEENVRFLSFKSLLVNKCYQI